MEEKNPNSIASLFAQIFQKQFYITYGTSLLALVIENISSSELNPACKLTLKERLFQICYDKLMALDYLDVNVGYEQYVESLIGRNDLEANDENNRTGDTRTNQNSTNQNRQTAKRPINLPAIKRASILQQTVNDLKYDVAERLVLKGARIDELNVDDVVFVKSTERLFKALYFCGYRFLPANIFKLKYDQCIKDDDCFERFCEFLKKHQTKQLPLSCLGRKICDKQQKGFREFTNTLFSFPLSLECSQTMFGLEIGHNSGGSGGSNEFA